MWVEELPNGKYKYFERYKDAYTEKWKRVSVTLNSGSNRAKKEAQRLLDDKIAQKIESSSTTNVSFQEPCGIRQENIRHYRARDYPIKYQCPTYPITVRY